MRVCLSGASTIGGSGIALLILKLVLSLRYDPNNSQEREERLRCARSRTISKDELEKMTGARDANAKA